MAPADAGNFILDEEDDDFFGEYNPHPYRGGYDIAATFGTPLPPSANICYPVSSSAATAVLAIPSPPSPTKAPADPPPKEPYGDKEAPREPVYKSPEVFPKEEAARKGKGRRGGRWRRRFWKKCVRGLDILFCYKDPYGEQGIVVDNYVVPVYVNTKESGKDSLSVEDDMAPLEVGIIVEAHDANEELYQSNDLPSHTNDRDETNTYSQSMSNSYYIPFAQSYGLPDVLGKSDWFLNFSYSGSHQLEEFQHEVSLSCDVEHNISGEPIRCYHHHCYKPPVNVQVEPLEPVSSQRSEYYEHFSTHCDQSDSHILEAPAHAYNIQSYTPIYDVPLQPFKSSWSQNWGFYDAQGNALENNTNSQTFGEYGGIASLFISPFYPGEAETFGPPPSDEHASFQHNWHNLSCQNIHMDDVSPITQPNSQTFGEYGGIASLFISPFYPGEAETFGPPPSDEHASFQHNWHNLSCQNIHMDDVSPITQPNSQTFGEYGGIASLFISPFYPGEAETFGPPPSDEHASFQHNWHNLSCQNIPMDDVSPITQPNSQTFGEYGGIASLFISPFYPGEAETFGPPPSDEHASFQHNWHNLSCQNIPMDDVSPITQPADDSYSMNGSIWPFGEHSAYNV